MSLHDAIINSAVRLHKAGYRLSRGKLLNRGAGMPVLMLTTRGRKSGEPRTTILTTPLQDGDRIMLVASNNGGDRDPAWVHNLRADPQVEVTMNGTARPMTARVAEPAEKAALWPRIVADHGHYGGYQNKTDRDIPVVVLEPSSTGTSSS